MDRKIALVKNGKGLLMVMYENQHTCECTWRFARDFLFCASQTLFPWTHFSERSEVAVNTV